ncbi:MAG: tetratricopeptide repeat protein [Lysobacteraceae bacterium]
MGSDPRIADACTQSLTLLAAGDIDGAGRLLDAITARDDARVAYVRGLIAMLRGEPRNAREHLATAATQRPNDAAVHANWALCLYQCDANEEALAASDHALVLAPNHADNHHNRGLILLALNLYQRAASSFERAVQLAPQHARGWTRLAETRHALGATAEAEVAYRRALELTPDDAGLMIGLGALLCDVGAFADAAAISEHALALDPTSAKALTQHAIALHKLGRLGDAMTAIEHALDVAPGNADALKTRALLWQLQDDLPAAAEDFLRAAQLHFAPGGIASRIPELRRTSRAKLAHDIEQFAWLQDNKLLNDAGALLDLHARALASLPDTIGNAQTIDLPASLLRELDGCYNRFHLEIPTPALRGGALNPALDTHAIQADYAARKPGITWIDNLLRPETLDALRRYCMGSTFWFDFHHVNGYLGAFFEDGFAAPLLLQIAQELRQRFPDIFRDYKLTQLWAFKYDSRLEGIELHADIAAVNLNFWITPDTANLDPESGGLVVWDKSAPPDWGLDEFNTSTVSGQARIQRFLHDSGAQAVRIPYRQNRAVLFNSDLFHRTDTIDFREGYANRRINITMLFGRREGRTH